MTRGHPVYGTKQKINEKNNYKEYWWAQEMWKTAL